MKNPGSLLPPPFGSPLSTLCLAECRPPIRPRLGIHPITLGSLLANERAVGRVLKVLKDTELGSREEAREIELELRRKNDQEGENLLDD